MKSVTFVLCLLVLGAHSLLFVFAEHCEIDGQKLSVGQTYSPPKHCYEYTCQEDKILTAKGCPAFATLKPCKMEEDLSKPYPDCCPKFDC